MPNWASTCYVMEAKPEQAKELYDKIDSLTKMERPLVENGFGILWMGCLVNLLGGDWNKIYCRGEIISYTLEDSHVSLSCETAWGEMPEFRHFIEQHYPGSKVYYCVEESGNCVYATNDADGLYFKDRYCLDFYDGLEYFETIEEAAKFIGARIGKEPKPDFTEIENAIDNYLEEHDDEEEAWMSFHQFEVLEDQAKGNGCNSPFLFLSQLYHGEHNDGDPNNRPQRYDNPESRVLSFMTEQLQTQP